MSSYASDGTSSASEESSAELPVVAPPRLAKRKSAGGGSVKNRKTTYYARKDEIETLEDQIRRLTKRLARYERTMPINTSGLSDSLVANALLARSVEQSTLSLAGTQSLMSSHTLAMIRATGVVPLKDYIHLPKDIAQRNAILSSMYESKLYSAAQFMAERTRFLDLSIPHELSERFELPDGQLSIVSLDVTQFNGGHSIRQVFNAFKHFIVHQEMSISEKLGMLTIRESDDLEEVKFGQSRFLSSVPGGAEVELNVASFGTCVDATPDAPGFALDTMDFVDVDDLYPYRPDICVRKELTGAVALHEIASLTGGKPTIAMARWSYVRVVLPLYPLSEEAANACRTGIAQWRQVIPRVMKEVLAATPPAP